MDENGSPNNPAMRAFIKEGVITGKDAEKLQHTFITLIRRYLRLHKHKGGAAPQGEVAPWVKGTPRK